MWSVSHSFKRSSPLFRSFTTVENEILAKPMNQTCIRIVSTLISSLKYRTQYTECLVYSEIRDQWRWQFLPKSKKDLCDCNPACLCFCLCYLSLRRTTTAVSGEGVFPFKCDVSPDLRGLSKNLQPWLLRPREAVWILHDGAFISEWAGV